MSEMLNKTSFEQITRAFYQKKWLQYGPRVESVGWNDAKKQKRRFEVLCDVGDIVNSSVLDAGCGFGDLYGFLRESGIAAQYTGVDAQPEFIAVAKERFPGARFECFDLNSAPPSRFPARFDYVLASGLFGLDVGDNRAFREQMLERLFDGCARAVAANFVSSYVDYREDYLAYTGPEEVVSFCMKSLTKKVVVRHDYFKFEFTVYLYR